MTSLFNLSKEQRSTTLPLLFFTAFFIGNAILGYFSIHNVAKVDALVSLARHNINLINALHIEVLRAESGQRGYLLTDLESYAEPYNVAIKLIDQRILDFSSTSFDAGQQALLTKLLKNVQEKLVEMAETISSIRSNHDSEAIQALFTHRGRNLMREISSISAQMEAHERGLLEIRMESASESRTTSFYLILTANIVGLIMVFVSMKLIDISQQKEKVILESLQDAKNNLEIKVEERTSALQHFSNELKRSNRELQDFAFVASHDLQEPLRKIRAFGDRLTETYANQLDAQGVDYIQRMQVSATRMSSLIDDLLSFSRITSTAKPFLPVNLQEVIGEILEDLEVSIEKSQAVINTGEMPVIEADRFQMKQLLQNLISNALKFQRIDQSPVITITSSIERSPTTTEGGNVILSVQDNGIGFDERFEDKIFMPFQRLHGKNSYEGTGIGLAICRRIVERHGGSIRASSIPGSGSCFEINLPLQHSNITLVEEDA